MIPYEELVKALDELNGRAPARPKQEFKPKASGSLPKAQSQPALRAVAPEEDFGAPLPAAAPVTTEVPELGDSFEVLTEEPMPPTAEAAPEDFDILSESELPPPPAAAPAEGQGYEVLGDQAFSGFFDGDAPGAPVDGELADAPTPPPEDDFDIDLPPPPPPPA